MRRSFSISTLFAEGRALYLLAVGAVLVFLLLPLVFVVSYAVNPVFYIDFPPRGFSLMWFEKFLTTERFTNALFLSLRVAVMALVLSLLFGVTAAIGIARGTFRGRQVLLAVFMSPLLLPMILTGLALFQSLITLGIGIPTWALVLGHSLIGIPYVIRTTLASLQGIDTRLEEAAANLGASPFRVYREVTLPMAFPGMMAGGVFAFIASFDQFPISLFLVRPGDETLPIAMFNHLRFELDGTIAAASMVSILAACVVVLVLEKTVGLNTAIKL